jgi:hypothetical protein
MNDDLQDTGEINTLDEAYFHLSNSGINVCLVEERMERTRQDLVRVREHTFYVDFQMHAFNTKLSLRLPLETSAFAHWLGWALVRASKKMRVVEQEEQMKYTSMEEPQVKYSSGAVESG